METRIVLPPLPEVVPEKKKEKRRLYVLGADDPEMEEIARLLSSLGRDYAYATFHGMRVHPANAYEADPVQCEDGITPVFVECFPREFSPGHYVPEYVDHHRKGDIGFNAPPEHYMLGSSLGQVAMLEGVSLTEVQLVIAALDHCPAQAMRGMCPGVDPERAKLIYHAETARRRNVPIEAVYACMQEVGKDMAIAPSAKVAGIPVVDMRGFPTGVGYSLRYLSTIGAAINVGIAVLLSNRNGEQDREKHVLTGLVTPDLVRGFMDDYAPRYPLSHIWGDNNRGAGGFVSR